MKEVKNWDYHTLPSLAEVLIRDLKPGQYSLIVRTHNWEKDYIKLFSVDGPKDFELLCRMPEYLILGFLIIHKLSEKVNSVIGTPNNYVMALNEKTDCWRYFEISVMDVQQRIQRLNQIAE